MKYLLNKSSLGSLGNVLCLHLLHVYFVLFIAIVGFCHAMVPTEN